MEDIQATSSPMNVTNDTLFEYTEEEEEEAHKNKFYLPVRNTVLAGEKIASLWLN